ncbi:MAG TPA: type II CAAX endopeptidase family protein [Candidatus Sulfotelmatobacter sp.]|nr:type II CAAX endopeptidase family protein [Candidatus Sulfotelmatobacter sp.]
MIPGPPVAEDPETNSEIPPPTEPAAASGPPGSRTFSIEGRAAPGLYVAAWFLGLVGALLIVLAVFDAAGAAAIVFLGIGLVVLVLACSAAAGYQLVGRAARPATAYRGPAPLLVLGFVLAFSTLIELGIGATGVIDQLPTVMFLLAVLIPAGVYFLAVHVFVVRGGALSWATIARLRPGPAIRRGGDWLVGAAAGISLVVPVLIGSALLTTILGSVPNSDLPRLTSDVDGLVILVGAVVVAPIGEEVFFRGFVYSAWRLDLGVGAAIRRSAILFAAVHVLNVAVSPSDPLTSIGAQVLVQFLVIVPAGLLLAFMYERRGLAASLGAHMAYNGGLLFLAALATRAVQGS